MEKRARQLNIDVATNLEKENQSLNQLLDIK